MKDAKSPKVNKPVKPTKKDTEKYLMQAFNILKKADNMQKSQESLNEEQQINAELKNMEDIVMIPRPAEESPEVLSNLKERR